MADANKQYAPPGSREFAWWWAQKRRRDRKPENTPEKELLTADGEEFLTSDGEGFLVI